VRRVYLLVQTTRDGDELTTMAFASREAAEAKRERLYSSPPGGVSIEAALGVAFFVREMRIEDDAVGEDGAWHPVKERK